MNKKLIKIYSIGIFSIALIIVIVINLVDFEAILNKAEEEVKEKVEEVKEEVKEKVDAKKEETIVHETLHAIDNSLGLDLNEGQICSLANALFQLGLGEKLMSKIDIPNL